MKCYQFKVSKGERMTMAEFDEMSGSVLTDGLEDSSYVCSGSGEVWAIFEVEAIDQETATKMLESSSDFEGYKVLSVEDITVGHFERLKAEKLEDAEDAEAVEGGV